MSFPLVDLKAQYRSIEGEINEAIRGVLESARFVGGPEVSRFEAEFAQYCQAQHCVGLSSGTAALSLALEACGIGAGDEVITTTHTFVATAEAIAKLGAKPVLVDVDPATYTIDPRQTLAAVTARTKAIIPVHLYGHPADLDPILDICARYGLVLVEDAAQAHGALYKGQRIGSFGHVACFSFYPGKNLGAYGDAGAVVTNDAALASKVAMLADHGRAPGSKYEHTVVGYNHRLDALQAAVLRVKLRHLDNWNERRRAIAARYNKLLAEAPVVVPRAASWAVPVYHLYVVQVARRQRPGIQQGLSDAGIATGIHYPLPVHLQPAFTGLGLKAGDLPVAEALAGSVLSLPMYPELLDSEVDLIAARLLEALRLSAG